jgi:hypothetical protein
LKANPRISSGVLFELYIDTLRREPKRHLPVADVGLLYEALKSQISPRQRASVEVSSGSEDDESSLMIQFSIIDLHERSSASREYGPFEASAGDVLELRTPLTNVFIEAPIWAILGDGITLQIEVPSEILVENLILAARQVFVHAPIGNGGGANLPVVIGANEAEVDNVQQVTVTHSNLSVSWPGVRRHPWSSYAYDPVVGAASGDIDFLRRRVRRVLTAFRSHSRGALVRYAQKIDHLRMTKDRRGQFLVKCLVDDGVLSTFEAGRFYQLDPVRMGDLMGMDYIALQKRQFTTKCDRYLQSVLDRMNAATSG